MVVGLVFVLNVVIVIGVVVDVIIGRMMLLVLMLVLVMTTLVLFLGARTCSCSGEVGRSPAPAVLPFWQEKWREFPFPARATGKSGKFAGKAAG